MRRSDQKHGMLHYQCNQGTVFPKGKFDSEIKTVSEMRQKIQFSCFTELCHAVEEQKIHRRDA